LKCKGIIAGIAPGSIADGAGLVAGDQLIAVNGQAIQDIIDLSFALADEYVELCVERKNGRQEIIKVEKEYGCDLGLEFDSAVFDQVRRCSNRCIFCFVDQMPPGMRESLYVKDDDYRLSFLYGNFVTLTNTTNSDIKRILKLHLSPLYVSVHATDSELRKRLLGNNKAGNIINQLKMLTDHGIELHTQVVLCPDINDGAVLDKTIADLYALSPGVLSLAVVPVGLTKYRENCFPMHIFSTAQAIRTIELVSSWQERCRKECGHSFVYLADEFYLMTDYPIPEYDMYDDFPQLENGVGIVRNFINEWEEEANYSPGYEQRLHLDIVCGISAAKILEPLLTSIHVPNLAVRTVAVTNLFFGSQVTVTGLLTGGDILTKLVSLAGPRDGVIIPGVALRKGETVFLDNMTPEQLEQSLGVPVRIAYSAKDLHRILSEWR